MSGFNVAGRGVTVSGRGSDVGETGFDPNSLANLHAWYDATKLDGFSDGQQVNTWPDESGAGNDLSRASGSPLYQTNIRNGNPVIEFSSNERYSTSGLSSFNYPYTLFIVAKLNDGGISREDLIDHPVSDTQAGLLYYDPNPKMYAGSSISWGSGAETDWKLLTLKYDGTNSEAWEDGSQQTTGDTGTNTLGERDVGATSQNGGDRWFTGYMGEIIIYNDKKGGTSQDDVEQYLADKWGFTI